MQRRSFLAGLAGCLAAGFAPAAVNSKILMPVKKIQTPSPILTIDARSLVIRDGRGNVIFYATASEVLSISEGRGRHSEYMNAIGTGIKTGRSTHLVLENTNHPHLHFTY